MHSYTKCKERERKVRVCMWRVERKQQGWRVGEIEDK